MNRRLLIIIIAVTVLVVPAIIIAFVINRSPKLQNTVLELANINANGTNANVEVNANVSENVNSQAAADQGAITFASRNFAEVYGSGSNQNDFSNIVESQKYATKSFIDFLNRDIIRQRKDLKTTPYHEIITKALVVTINKQAGTTAAIMVSTQRQETIGDETKVYYQDLLVDLVKVGSEWKVNAALWKSVESS